MEFKEIIKTFGKKKILVIGDLILDHYIYGYAERISREAPIPILRFESERYELGGAANTAKNIASLGARTLVIGAIGEDQEGEKLLELLSKWNIDWKGEKKGKTLRKLRILAGGEFTKRQQVARIDWGNGFYENSLENLVKDLTFDAAIISDYGYGTAKKSIYEELKKKGKPIIIDSRNRLTEFKGATAATPNVQEAEFIVGRKLNSIEEFYREGKILRERLSLEALLITLGNKGLILIQSTKDPVHIKAFGGSNIVDVTGAGDTVAAVFTLSIASGADFETAATLANIAGGLSVMKEGASSLSPGELLEGVEKWELSQGKRL
ncbi:MAG: bifunctional hydroxymethylpyrimidine kinase/phosphomethylpyrimidine kinase [Candidatus Aminicenantes bacterium]|nr:bifunctional hydroxymethylpyrimidine kinase/phosphomethylpyrimidine kinase [Candidatus Aminicenantes bacterium]